MDRAAERAPLPMRRRAIAGWRPHASGRRTHRPTLRADRGRDPILTLLLACHPGADVHDVEVTLGDPPTVVHLSWQTDDPTSGRVHFQGRATPWTATGTAHRATVLGLPTDTEVDLELELDGGERHALDPITTGPLPVALPELEVEGDLDGEYLLIPVLGNAVGPVIIDDEGRYVWWHLVDDEDAAVYRAWISRDGLAVLYGAIHSGEIIRVPFGGGAPLSVSLPNLGHDFLELPAGGYAAITSETREVDGVELRGDLVVEVNDGVITEVWNAWDHLDPLQGSPSDSSGLSDWTHANALDYLPDEDAYLVNLLRRQALIKIDSVGDMAWVLSDDEDNDFTFAEGTTAPGAKHQFALVGDGLLVFHNRAHDRASTIDRYWLDQDALSLEEDWSYTSDPEVSTLALGDVELLPSGTVHANWGTGGVMRQLDPDLETTWLLTTPVGTAFGYTIVLQGLYPTE